MKQERAASAEYMAGSMFANVCVCVCGHLYVMCENDDMQDLN